MTGDLRQHRKGETWRHTKEDTVAGMAVACLRARGRRGAGGRREARAGFFPRASRQAVLLPPWFQIPGSRNRETVKAILSLQVCCSLLQ